MIDMVMDPITHRRFTDKNHTISYLVTRMLAEAHDLCLFGCCRPFTYAIQKRGLRRSS